MKYKAVLFDMDGTVLDTLRDLNAAVNACMEHFSLPHQTLDETRRRVGNGSRRLMELSAPAGTGDEKIEEMLGWYLPYYNRHANDTTAPYPGISELMRSLSAQGLRLAIVSNKPDRTVRELAEIHFPGRRGSRAWRPDSAVPVCRRLGGGCADGIPRGDGLRLGAVGLSQS